MDSHLSCSICTEIIVEAFSVNKCGHTFCKVCIERWNRSMENERCPMCRSWIYSIIPIKAVDGYIDKVHEEYFDDDARAARKALHEERAAQKEDLGIEDSD